MTKEKFIPASSEQILEKLIAKKIEANDEKDLFKVLFTRLEHFFHYDSFAFNKKLKLNYAQFDPDRLAAERQFFETKEGLEEFRTSFNEILFRGNFEEIDRETIEKSFNSSDLVGLKLYIDFNDFKEYKLFARGRTKGKEKIKKWIFWKKEIEIEYYDRVVLYLHYNEAEHFRAKKENVDELVFAPNTIVIKVFKRVPVNDIETIFPNAEPRMSTKDKLLLWVPAIGGGVPIITAKVIPALGKINEAYASNNVSSIEGIKTTLIQSGAILAALGAYIFKQYGEYQTKKSEYQKLLTDSLYFKNLGNNSGAFHSLLDASEEEEIKETLLVYCFLFGSPEGSDAASLDTNIEEWFRYEFESDIDFDIQDALNKLHRIGLAEETNGVWKAMPLEHAVKHVDEIWDGLFGEK